MSLLRRKIKRSAIACLSLTMCVSLVSGCADLNAGNKNVNNTASTNKLSFTDVTDKYDTMGLTTQNFNSSVLKGSGDDYETRTVVVTLSGNCILDLKNSDVSVSDYLQTAEGMSALRSIDREQKTFLSKLSSQGINYTLTNTYSTITNAVAIEVNTSYVKKIKGFGGVAGAFIAQTYLAPQVEEGSSDGGYTATVNDANVYATGIYNSSAYSDTSVYPWGQGDGVVVAVIDTGLDYSHDAFQKLPTNPAFTKDKIATKIATSATPFAAAQRMALSGKTLTADDVFVSAKIPFAFDYADNDADVYPSYSNHGTHVAGIVAGNDPNGYDDKNGVHQDTPFLGVAPNAQLVICKTFTDDLDSNSLGGAESADILAALEDCANLGVDVINMSLGTTAGFTTSDDGDSEGEAYDAIFTRIQNEGISLICAASNDYSAGYGSVYGTNLASNPDSGTVGSPSSYFAALSVASISGQEADYLAASDGSAIFIENASNGTALEYDFVDLVLGEGVSSKEFTYVDVGLGQQSNYRGKDVSGKIVLIKRGVNSFQEKIELAAAQGAAGALIWNNVSGTIRMSLGDANGDAFVPAASITMDAGNKLLDLTDFSGEGKLTVDRNLSAGPFMSSFSSWGPTPDLKIKPEITAHGGEITSTVPGGYAEQSGTSMASPNMAGLTALVRNYVKDKFDTITEPADIIKITNQLIMSTASTAYDENHLPYSPRKQGAGLANLNNIVNTNAYIFTDSDTEYYYDAKDNRPKVELGADTKKTGVYTFNFKVANFGSSPLTFKPQSLFMTETLDSEKVAVAERAYMLNGVAPVFSVDGVSANDGFTVAGGGVVTLDVTLKLSDAEKKYLDDSFKNGMFVEGFIKLTCDNNCDLNLPFLSFYGDWEAAPMLDYSVFEIADFQQDSSILEEEKPSETVWATQAYGSYSNGNYVIPLGSFLYTVGDGDPVYADVEHCAISKFNYIVSDDGIGNYVTTYNIRCLYAGLLRNAKKVNYTLRDAYTGELIMSGVKNRLSKAYANGGSASPSYVELYISAEELGLVSNGKYTLEFDFRFTDESEKKEENTFTFDFYVDYEAPVLQDARVRYYNTTDANGNDTQRIYLDLDIFDNHYAQSVMLCYIDSSNDRQELKLATDYVTPVRNANKNGTTTVSIDVTDIWDEYKDVLAVQIDDYALNHTSYVLSGLNTSVSVDASLNSTVLPDTFELAEGEENLTLNINEMHKVSLVYEGSADLSNFTWTSPTHYIDVKNGEIVGRASTNGKAYPVMVTNNKGVSKIINVTVTDSTSTISGLSFSFGPIVNAAEGLQKAQGTVDVYAGVDIKLELLPTPWYFNGQMSVTWSTSDDSVASVQAGDSVKEGLVHTKKSGSGAVVIMATVVANGVTNYVTVSLNVLDEFTVSGMSLTRYRGEGETIGGQEHVVVFPAELNIMTIGEDAFRDNTVIEKIIIPKTVTSIGENAFKGCTALKEVYFMSDDKNEDYDKPNSGFVADSDLTIINKNAFEGCTALTYLDLRYTKVFTVAKEAFKDCVSLETIVKPTAIGTARERAFMGCKSLKSFDMTGLHVAGANVFSGCTSLSDVKTGQFTAIGEGMFASVRYVYAEYDYSTGEWNNKTADYDACNALTSITIKTSTVSDGAFYNCENLEAVTFDGVSDARIGASAFENCKKLTTVNFSNGTTVKTIGARAFAGTALTGISLPAGIESIGAGAFSGIQSVGRSNYTVTDNAIISGTTLLMYIGGDVASYTVPSGVTAIAPYAFANAKINTIDISSVTEIGEGAFSGSSVSVVKFSSSLKTIGASAFRGTQISSLQIPVSVTYVGDYAFAETPLTDLNYQPANKAEFGNGVFYRCRSLSRIEFGDNLATMGNRTFEGCSALQTVNLPELKSLGAYTFYNTPALKEVTFSEGSTTVGTFTFAASQPESRYNFVSVTIPSTVKTIGEGVFYNCTRLGKVNLNNVTAVEDYAFFNCNMLEVSLEKLVTIGDNAFSNNNRLSSLNLASATSIGEGAFMITSGRSYTEISFPVAENIGRFAFYGGNEKTVTIPATLKCELGVATEDDKRIFATMLGIGDGAFAASPSLTEFIVASGNESYTVIDGALYRYITETTYGLVAYPSAVSASEFEVVEGTVTVDGHAFRGLYGKIGKVVLPYSLKTVGANAFYQSGITVYEFKGVTAPALEAEYSETVDAYIETVGQNFTGFYNANFEDYFVYYSEFGTGANVKPLTLYCPTNGTGYNNHIYSQYFATKIFTGVTMSTDTNAFIQFIDSCPTADEISKWSPTGANAQTKEDVEAFSELVKSAHEYYDNFRNDEEQVKLAGDDRINKFLAVETALRGVKPSFGISVSVVRLSASGDFKTQYKVGETFDMTGLKVIIEYDDYSTEEANMADVTLVSPTGPLDVLNNEVRLSLKGYSSTLRIRIYVTEGGNEEEQPPKKKGCGSVVEVSASLVAIAVMGVAIVFVSRKNRGIK